MKGILALIICLCVSTLSVKADAVYNKTLQIGEVLKIPPVRPGTGYAFANYYTNSNSSVAGVSLEKTSDYQEGNMSWFRYNFIIVGQQAGITTINLGCKDSNGFYGWATYIITVVAIKTITIPNDISLLIGENYTFTPIIIDEGAKGDLSWISSNASVATINGNGTLSATAIGTTTVTCIAPNGISAQCKVLVCPVLAESIVLNKTNIECYYGDNINLSAKFTPDNVTDKTITWSSTNETVAVVSESGLVTAVGRGICQIKAAANDGSGKFCACIINVPDLSSKKADVNGDGTVDVADIANVISVMASKDDEGHNEGPIVMDYTECPDDNHPHMIDLGLPSGTKWACCNMDATMPELYGGYYAWGEKNTKSDYSWETYIFGYYNNDNDYSHLEDIGADISGTIYDVATTKWGASWCIPTPKQFIELINYTKSEWTSLNNTFGHKFTGANGGAIFIPAAGRYIGDVLKSVRTNGYYWSSTIGDSGIENAHVFNFDSEEMHVYRNAYRYHGRTIRPVYTK